MEIWVLPLGTWQPTALVFRKFLGQADAIWWLSCKWEEVIGKRIYSRAIVNLKLPIGAPPVISKVGFKQDIVELKSLLTHKAITDSFDIFEIFAELLLIREP